MYRFIINEQTPVAGTTLGNSMSGLTALDLPRSADPLPLKFGVFAHCVGYLPVPLVYGYRSGSSTAGTVVEGIEQTLRSFVIGEDGTTYGVSYSYDYFQTQKINPNFTTASEGILPSYSTSTSAGFPTGGLEFFMGSQYLAPTGSAGQQVAGTAVAGTNTYNAWVVAGHPVNLITTVSPGVVRSLRPSAADYYCPVAASCAVANGTTAIQTGGMKSGISVATVNFGSDGRGSPTDGLKHNVYSAFIHRFIVDGTRLDVNNVALANSKIYAAAASIGPYACVYGGMPTIAGYMTNGVNNECSRYDTAGALVSGAVTNPGVGISFPTAMGFAVNGATPSRGLFAGLVNGSLYTANSSVIGIASDGTYVMSEVINHLFKSAAAATVINQVGIIKHGNVNVMSNANEYHSSYTLDKRYTRSSMDSAGSVVLTQSGLETYIAHSGSLRNTSVTRINSSGVFLDVAKYLDDTYNFAGSGYTIG